MVRAIIALGLLTSVGCSSVKVVQRDGCWVRRTERPFKRVVEELGPCGRPATQWAEDRTTRILQECVVQADHRWQAHAVDAWNQGEPLPERASDEALLAGCIREASTGPLIESERLATRLAELTAERRALEARIEADRQHLVESHQRLAADLGEAAKKEPAPAVATATATSEGRSEGRSDEGAPPTVTVVGLPSAPATAPVTVVGLPSTPAAAPAACVLPPGSAAPAEAAPMTPVAEPRPRPSGAGGDGAALGALLREKAKPAPAQARRPPVQRPAQQPGCTPEELAAARAEAPADAGATRPEPPPPDTRPEPSPTVTPAADRGAAAAP